MHPRYFFVNCDILNTRCIYIYVDKTNFQECRTLIQVDIYTNRWNYEILLDSTLGSTIHHFISHKKKNSTGGSILVNFLIFFRPMSTL